MMDRNRSHLSGAESRAGGRSPEGRTGRKIRFAEAGVLFAVILALVVVAGLQLMGNGKDEGGGATTRTVATMAVDRSASLDGSAPASADVADPAGAPAVGAGAEPTAGGAALAQVPARTGERLRPVTYEEAEQAYQAGRFAEAVDLFAAYVDLKPDNAWGHYMLGLSSWKAGDPEGAREALEQALVINPRHFKSHLNLARVLLDLDQPAAALAHAETASAADPRAPDIWRVMGRALDESGRQDDAVGAYLAALRLDPDDAWSLNNLGLILLRQERFAEALPPLARAATLRPGEARFQNNLGVALERTGHLQAAAEAYAAAVAAEPDHERAGVSLARVEQLATSDPGEPVDLAALAASFSATLALQNGSDGAVPGTDADAGAVAVRPAVPDPLVAGEDPGL